MERFGWVSYRGGAARRGRALWGVARETRSSGEVRAELSGAEPRG